MRERISEDDSGVIDRAGERTLHIGRDRPIRISAGHRLRHHDGKCSRPHGHNYEVTVTDEIHLARVEAEFRNHGYPAARDDLAESCAGTTVLFADGDA